MSEEKRQEFRSKVKAVHDAVDEYAESRLSGANDWFVRGLDGEIRSSVERLLSFEVREIILRGGPRDGMIINTSTPHSIEVAYIDGANAVRCDPDAPKPWTEIKTVRYRSSNEWDEGREIYKPDWATLKAFSCDP